MTIFYEWDVEVVTDDKDSDVEDHLFCGSYAKSVARAKIKPEPGTKHDIVLVMDDDNNRGWAYIEDGKLPEFFEDAYQHQLRKVPQRFYKEVRMLEKSCKNSNT